MREVHRDHVRAGAAVVTANTFRTDRRTLARAGVHLRARDLVRTAVLLAREGIAEAAPAHRVVVAGSIAPLEDCFRPDLVPGDAELRAEHGSRVGDLVAAGADMALVETMNTVREAVAALGACRAGRLPAAVSFTCAPGARLLSGETVADAVAAVRGLATPRDPRELLRARRRGRRPARDRRRARARSPRARTRTASGVPTTSRAGASSRATAPTARPTAAPPPRWLDAGARWIGGCCGTTPEYVADLRDLIDGRIATGA